MNEKSLEANKFIENKFPFLISKNNTRCGINLLNTNFSSVSWKRAIEIEQSGSSKETKRTCVKNVEKSLSRGIKRTLLSHEQMYPLDILRVSKLNFLAKNKFSVKGICRIKDDIYFFSSHGLFDENKNISSLKTNFEKKTKITNLKNEPKSNCLRDIYFDKVGFDIRNKQDVSYFYHTKDFQHYWLWESDACGKSFSNSLCNNLEFKNKVFALLEKEKEFNSK